MKNKFYKVSYDQYKEASADRGGDLDNEYNDIKMPKRATKFSAGYDFYAPFEFTLQPGADRQFPTGIGIELEPDKFLALYPRSGLGFKYKLGLANTVGIIDADYSFADNGGQIGVKLCNNGVRAVHIEKGQAFMQGIIQQYFVTCDDDADGDRTGGFGSTDQ